MGDQRCAIKGCRKCIDERSGLYGYCTNHWITHQASRIAELEKTKLVMERIIEKLNRLVAGAIDEDRLS